MRAHLIPLFGLVVVACLGAPSAALADPITFTVGTTSDAPDSVPGDHVCATAAGACSLRAAIDEANRHPGPDAIRFAIPGGAPQGIHLANGKLVVNQPDLSIDGTRSRVPGPTAIRSCRTRCRESRSSGRATPPRRRSRSPPRASRSRASPSTPCTRRSG